MRKNTLIVAGGELSPAFLTAYMASHPVDDLIAADRGLDVLRAAEDAAGDAREKDAATAAGTTTPERTGAVTDASAAAAHRHSYIPDLLVGDFDSTSEKHPEYLSRLGTEVEIYPCEKDFSDLESALRAAIARGSTEITILGAVGGRLDHFLANVMDLRIPLAAGIPARIADEQNVICLHDGSFVLEKDKAFGRYISFLPLEGRAEHISLKGFKYSGTDITLDQNYASYGISNEITEERAEVSFSGAVLIVVESKDA